VISFWEFFVFMNNLQQENSTNEEDDIGTYWPMQGKTAVTVK
jgi:hypothetical protein